MAKLYATSPNGTAKSIQLETMNIIYGESRAYTPDGLLQEWIKLPTILGPIIMRGRLQGSSPHLVTLPIRIPNKYNMGLSIVAGPGSPGIRNCGFCMDSNWTEDSFSIYCLDTNGNHVNTMLFWTLIAYDATM